MKPASRVDSIQEYYFSRKLKEVAKLNAEGKDIISLAMARQTCHHPNKPSTSYAPWQTNLTRMATNQRADCQNFTRQWLDSTSAPMAWTLTPRQKCNPSLAQRKASCM